ncbi:MAG: EexN family lipoprotein [Burkholderiales bacterium]|nr:EexN family lipoprotein [Burkholderiales bacterium]
MFRLPNTLTALAVLTALTTLSACSDKAPTDTVESLLANPERLKELRAQCKADHAQVGDATCNAVSEATRQRFMGAGTPYTPAPAKD